MMKEADRETGDGVTEKGLQWSSDAPAEQESQNRRFVTNLVRTANNIVKRNKAKNKYRLL